MPYPSSLKAVFFSLLKQWYVKLDIVVNRFNRVVSPFQ